MAAQYCSRSPYPIGGLAQGAALGYGNRNSRIKAQLNALMTEWIGDD